MENKTETQTFNLEVLKVSNLPELIGWKEKQETLVKENPYIEITDNKSYDLACKSRTALLKGRTSLEGQDKVITSKLAGFRKEVKTETDNLVNITLPHEEKQQAEVRRYESIKETERLERERIELERVESIKNKISSIESDAYAVIQKMAYYDLSVGVSLVSDLLDDNSDFEEYEILFEQVKTRVQTLLDSKISDLNEKEAQRIDNERLAKEASEAKAKAKELQDKIDADKIESDHKAKEVQDKIDANNLEREEKEKRNKEVAFEIRKKRLLELGTELIEGYFMTTDGAVCSKRDVFMADIIDFETIFTDTKLDIVRAKSEKIEAEKQAEADKKKSIEDAEILKKENKARIKKFESDKIILNDMVNELQLVSNAPIVNKESIDLRLDFDDKLDALKSELLMLIKKL